MAEATRKLGPYKLISKIGSGAFGVVWLAEKQTSIATTRVALKLARDEEVDLEAFRQEAAIWIQASGHPNVLPMIDADIYDERVVIVSEYVPDGSLAGWLKRNGGKAPSIEAACGMIDGMLAGLAHLHERRIIHRDLKPENILLQRDTPRLADFGISRLLRTGSSYSTNISGTLAYMAPEAFEGRRNQQTDLWAVGVIFYQLLAGRLPYVQPDMVSLIGALMRDDAPPLPENIPHVLRQIVMKALQRDPSRRYLSAEEMRQDLREAEHQLWLAQKEAPTITDNDTDTTQEQPNPIAVQATRSGAKWLITILAALLLLAVGGSIVVVKIVSSALSQANANQNQTADRTTSNNLNTAAPALGPAPSPTPDEAQLQQATDRYLAGVAKALSGNEEDKSLRKVIRGDIDGDGDTDVVVQFVLAPNEGNNAAVVVAVFINDNGKFKGVTDKVVGGNHLRDFELETVQPGRIVATTLECPGDEYPCENSMKRQAIIFWKNNKLIAPDRWIE